MKPNLKVFSLSALVAISCIAVFADVMTIPGLTWPDSWPKELERLRKRAKTYVASGGAEEVIYEIPFNNREEFESAWPHLLSLRSKGAPIFLQPGPARFQNAPTH